MSGKSIGQTDSLSRRADWEEEVERDNKNQIMLKKSGYKLK